MARDSEYRRVYHQRKSGIHIKSSKEGSLHKAMGISEDKKIPESKLKSEVASAKRSGNVAEEKKAVFAENARHWHHGG